MEEDDDCLCAMVASTVQMRVLGRPVWPNVLCALLEAADCSAWVGQRLAEVDFKQNRVPERNPASTFVDHVLACMELNQHDYKVSEDQLENVLAQLTLQHMLRLR